MLLHRNRSHYLERESAIDFKVVVRAEVLPRGFLQTVGNFYLSITIAKLQS